MDCDTLNLHVACAKWTLYTYGRDDFDLDTFITTCLAVSLISCVTFIGSSVLRWIFPSHKEPLRFSAKSQEILTTLSERLESLDEYMERIENLASFDDFLEACEEMRELAAEMRDIKQATLLGKKRLVQASAKLDETNAKLVEAHDILKAVPIEEMCAAAVQCEIDKLVRARFATLTATK